MRKLIESYRLCVFAWRIAQKRSAYLAPYHCVPGQGAKSLAGARGGSPASAAHRAETIGLPCSASLRKRVKGRSPLPGRGAGAPQARRIAQKRSAYLAPYHCVPGQGAKSLAGVRGGGPASVSHRAETIGFPYPAPLRTGSRGEVPCRGAGRGPRKRGVKTLPESNKA